MEKKYTRQMTKLEIIHELFESETGYINNPDSRAYVAGQGCRYLHTNGKRCAVGKCITNKYIKAVSEHIGGATNIASGMRIEGYKEITSHDDVMFKKYRGHEATFWRDLQHLHDGGLYWSGVDGAFTDAGLIELNSIKAQYH
jgi:hypothetical protein